MSLGIWWIFQSWSVGEFFYVLIFLSPTAIADVFKKDRRENPSPPLCVMYVLCNASVELFFNYHTSNIALSFLHRNARTSNN